jgi:geranylgeranyl diphosphate synthase type II
MQSISLYTVYFENEIGNYSFPNSPKNLYEPLKYFIEIGGKRIRPLLTLMASEMFGLPKENALQASLAIELFHNFSLIHDDIMDKAPLRRGKQTVHLKWNDDIAILSGDVLLIKAYQALAKQDARHIPALLDLFNSTAVEVCEGQQMDMDFESCDQVTIEAYIEMIRLKTSVLLGCALAFGAIVSDAPKKDRELIYAFGQNLGIAFQIQDDILDLYGDPEKFGKQIGGDIIANKKTLLLLKALELAQHNPKINIEEMLLIEDTVLKIETAKSMFNSLGVLAFAREQMTSYQYKALSALKEISVSSDRKKTLVELSEYLFQREV